jgi:hypothetical protein
VKSSAHMKKEGIIRCVKTFSNEGIQIQTLITDRHVQIVFLHVGTAFHFITLFKKVYKLDLPIQKEVGIEILNNACTNVNNKSIEDGCIFFVMAKPQETYIKQARRKLPWNIFCILF